MRNMTIAAVVVTYNRLKLLQRTIEYLQKQTYKVDNIIIVNNGSTDGTKEWLDDQKTLDIIHQDNIGGSGGFYTGIKYASERDYDWIWCMDDDVYPDSNCLENLLKFDDPKVGILCPMRIQNGKIFLAEVKSLNLSNPFKPLNRNKIKISDLTCNSYLNIEGMSFEGPLIKNEAIKKVGYPNKEYFILYDDTDYSYRFIIAGYKNLFINDAILNKELLFSNKTKVEFVTAQKWKVYYHIRNTVYFNKIYGRNWWVRNIRSIGMLIKYESFVIKNIFFNKKYQWYDIIGYGKSFVKGYKGELGKM